VAAVEACLDDNFNVMVALQADKIITVPIAEAASEPHFVPVDSDIIRAGRHIGINFGD
jgi:6-phosphofructokinase 1